VGGQARLRISALTLFATGFRVTTRTAFAADFSRFEAN
jgi:hypothetical protein